MIWQVSILISKNCWHVTRHLWRPPKCVTALFSSSKSTGLRPPSRSFAETLGTTNLLGTLGNNLPDEVKLEVVGAGPGGGKAEAVGLFKMLLLIFNKFWGWRVGVSQGSGNLEGHRRPSSESSWCQQPLCWGWWGSSCFLLLLEAASKRPALLLLGGWVLLKYKQHLKKKRHYWNVCAFPKGRSK